MNWAESATKHKLGSTILSKYQSILYAALDANHAHCKHLKCMAIIKMVFPSSGACDGCTAQKNSPRALLHRWAQNSTQCTERTVDQTECTVAQHPVLGEPCSTLPAVLTKNLESFPLLLLLTASPAPSLRAVLNRLLSESRWIYWGNNFVECLKKIESYVWRDGGGAQNRSRRFTSARSPWQLDLQQPIILNPAFT